MGLKRAILNAYRALRFAFWFSPLGSWLPAANVLGHLGYAARRGLGLLLYRGGVVLVNGQKMSFEGFPECYFDMTTGGWEPAVTALFERLLEPGMVVVDLGAHIGYFTLLAASKVGPGGRVYAFEPAPSNYELLVRNIALNGYQNVVPVQKAVSRRQGTSPFFLRSDSAGHSLYPTTLGAGKTAVNVETTTLDDFFVQEGWPQVHLVKMDIEGAEPAALDGATELLKRNRDVRLIVEFVPHVLETVGEDPQRFLEKLHALGFTTQMIRAQRELQELSSKMTEWRGFGTELLCERRPAPR